MPGLEVFSVKKKVPGPPSELYFGAPGGGTRAAGEVGEPCRGLGWDLRVDVCDVSPQDLVSTSPPAFLPCFLNNLPGVAAVHDLRYFFFFFNFFPPS